MSNHINLMKIFCCACKKDVDAILKTGTDIYPHLHYLGKIPFWQCPTCNNYVGCHHKTEDKYRPLGSIPSPRLRKLRKEIHDELDPLWRSGKFTRKGIYSLLSERVKREYHTADIREIHEAEEILEFVRSFGLPQFNCEQAIQDNHPE